MKKKLAFTLIEILIAISVFAIGILAVLRVLTGNLSTLDTANIKLQATVLAKEWIELLYNVRDSNLEKNLSWNCVMNSGVYTWSEDKLNDFYWNSEDPEKILCLWKFWVGKILKLSFDEKYYLYQDLLDDKVESFEDLFQKTQLCLFTWENMSWYAYCSDASQWEKQIFARYISFSPVYYGDSFSVDSVSNKGIGNSSISASIQSNVSKLSTDKILKVEVHVLYDKLGKTWDIVFESFIWNY